MLVTFRCRSYASVTMFGDIALQLIKMMGHSGTIPGSIGEQDVPQALAKLKAALAQHTATEATSQTDVHTRKHTGSHPLKNTMKSPVC